MIWPIGCLVVGWWGLKKIIVRGGAGHWLLNDAVDRMLADYGRLTLAGIKRRVVEGIPIFTMLMAKNIVNTENVRKSPREKVLTK